MKIYPGIGHEANNPLFKADVYKFLAQQIESIAGDTGDGGGGGGGGGGGRGISLGQSRNLRYHPVR